MSDFLSINRAAFEENGIAEFLDERTEALFARLCRIMQEKNEEMNVTAITDDDGVSRKHFCDCVFLWCRHYFTAVFNLFVFHCEKVCR